MSKRAQLLISSLPRIGLIAEKVVKLVQCPLLLLRSAKPEDGVKVPSGR